MVETEQLIQTAHAEFELLDWPFVGNSAGHLVYFRSHLQSWDVYCENRRDEDFIARLATLFGPPQSVRYALRDRKTDTIVFATVEDNAVGYTTPGFDANAAGRDPDVRARIAADPALAEPRPSLPLSSADGTLQRSRDYDRHYHDALAPRGFSEPACRLAALIEAAPPSEWELHHYDAMTEVVAHKGFRDGQPFCIHFEHADGVRFLVERAEQAALENSPETWNRTIEALGLAKARDLATIGVLRPRVIQLWRAQKARALAREDELRESALGWLERCAQALGLSDQEMAPG